MTVYPRITLTAGGGIHRGEADEALSLDTLHGLRGLLQLTTHFLRIPPRTFLASSRVTLDISPSRILQLPANRS